MANFRLTTLRLCPTITASGRPRRHGPAQSLPDSRIPGCDPEHHRAGDDCTQSRFPRRLTARIRLVAGSSTQRSPSKARRPGRKQAWPHRGHRQRMWRPEQPKMRPHPKSPINSSLRTLSPRSAPSAFSEEDIPALTVPRFTPGCDNSRGSGKRRIACLARRHTNDRSPQSRRARAQSRP
jgi:hypothetical protein